MNEKALLIAKKIPLIPTILLIVGYYTFEYNFFETDSSSEKVQKNAQLDSIKATNLALKTKLDKRLIEIQNLETKRDVVRNLAIELNKMKEVLTEDLDIRSFISTISTETKKVGIRLTSILPGKKREDQFYRTQEFHLKFRGVFYSVLVLLDRLANTRQVIRVGELSVKPIDQIGDKYVELDGSMTLLAYQYSRTKVDDVAKKLETLESGEKKIDSSSVNKPPAGSSDPGKKE